MTVRPRALLAGLALAGTAVLAVPADATPTATASYIVTVRPGAELQPVLGLTRALGGRIGFVYTAALHGFSVRLPVPALAALQVLPGVVGVEPDRVVSIDRSSVRTESNPPSYGLDRIDQRNLPLDGRYRYRADGRGVTAYVIDTGIRYDHVDFGRRAVKGVDEVTPGGTGADCNGHGTHVSGTLGGAQYGVAKAVRLVSVRVLGCDGSGSTSQVVAGIDWVIRNHAAGRPAVANMSLGGSYDPTLDSAVENGIRDGITFAVAAGNNGGSLNVLNDLLGNTDACNYSPADVPDALTVAASDTTDSRAGYSNIGPCVDLFAPGTGITSDWDTSRTATAQLSGTSMATPHVAGTAALFLATDPSATPAQVAQAVIGASTKDVLTVPSGTADRLVFQGW